MNLELKRKIITMLRKLALLTVSFSLLVCFKSFFDEEEAAYVKRQNDIAMFMQHININTLNLLKKNGRITKSYRRKRWWRKLRCSDWWERIVELHFTDEDFISNFRLSKKSFSLICSRLKKYLCSDLNIVREPLTVEKKCAIALYTLASCAEYRVIANQFGTNKCIVHKCLYAFCEAIIREFREEYLKMPNETEAEQVVSGFEKMCGIPNVVGAIDGTHIPILSPKIGCRDFLNRKGWPSYNVLAVVDNLYRFRYATCKHPGSCHDAKVLKDSNLYKSADHFLPNFKVKVNNVDTPCIILGDPAYPLLPWLMKPYKGRISREEESFNVYLSRGRVVVENAFGRLKARFRRLSKRMDINYKFSPKVVYTCLILHNIVESNKDTFIESWIDAVRTAEIIFPQPKTEITREHDHLQGGIIRDNLRDFMLKFPLRKSNLV